ncbi:unnamed protein product [Durusdinium trenchii]|uniref:Uncharacterized protein n=1 Tax=Durusdinium trenchii TaxID=1381693 RepID=A0ABP0QAB1_9DINO
MGCGASTTTEGLPQDVEKHLIQVTQVHLRRPTHGESDIMKAKACDVEGPLMERKSIRSTRFLFARSLSCPRSPEPTDSKSTASIPLSPTFASPVPPLPGIIHGDDLVDLDEYNQLMSATNSWERDGLPPTPRGVAVSFPPGRRMHDKHLGRIHRFGLKVEQDPCWVDKAVAEKRHIAEIVKELIENELIDVNLD